MIESLKIMRCSCHPPGISIATSLAMGLWLTLVAPLHASPLLDQPETWPSTSFEGWKSSQNYIPESGWLSLTNGALALNFPAGPGGANPPTPFSLAFMADTNSSGGRFTGNLAAAGATHLEFDFYGEATPGYLSASGGKFNLIIELFRADYGSQGLLFSAGFAVKDGWQRVIVPLALDYFGLNPGLTNQYAPPYNDEFNALLANLSRLYIRIQRGDTRSDAPAGQYRIDNMVLVQNNARSGQTITFPPVADQVATNHLVLNATASSGLPVVYSVTGPATITNGIMRFITDGTVSIVASQPGNANFNPAMPVARSFQVTRAAARIHLAGLQQSYNSQPRPVDATTGPAGLPVLIKYNDIDLVPVNPGSYRIHAMIAHPAWEGSATGTLSIYTGISGLDAPSGTGAPVVHFFSSASLLYQLQASTNLTLPPALAWSAVPGADPRRGVDGPDSLADTNRPPHGLFYRIRIIEESPGD